jgi:hypothetical protein
VTEPDIPPRISTGAIQRQLQKRELCVKGNLGKSSVVLFGLVGWVSVCAHAGRGLDDPEFLKAAQQAEGMNKTVDGALNPPCPKCEAIAGILPEVHKTVPLFRETKPIELEITADFNQLINKKGASTSATIQYLDEKGKPQSLPMNLLVRGNYKRDLCRDFVPLRVAFKKDQDLSDTPFKGMSDEFKIATHCRGKGKIEDSDINVQRIFREYTAYKALEALGFMSLKVRLAHIKYKMPNGEIYADASAFILEPKSNMAKRYGKKQIKQAEAGQAESLNSSQVLPFDFSVRFLTQNDSWNNGMHNGILVADKGSRKPNSVVPYDFDLLRMNQDEAYNGSVASYPKNDDRWLREKIQNSENPEEVRKVARYALDHKDAVMKAIANSPAQDVSVMKERAEAFFSSIDKVLKEPAAAPRATQNSTPMATGRQF